MNDVHKSIISGIISGGFASIVSHPFDTLKTWNQTAINKQKITINNLYKG